MKYWKLIKYILVKRKFQVLLVICFVVLFVANSCKHNSTPKPRGYFRIEFPEKTYQHSTLNYPYHFEYPSYAELVPDQTELSEPYWLNININAFNAKIHLSYKALSNNLAQLIDESHELAYKHTIKASSINEKIFINEKENVFGTIYEIKGNTASPLQFHLTDSINHFIRGSFYISAIPNYDSLRPIINFANQDIYHFIETLSWK